MDTAVFAPQYFGSIYYFASLYHCKEAIVDMGLRYNKRFKSVHRCEIVDTRGRLTLTVPIAKPGMEGTVGLRPADGSQNKRPLTWADITVSSHGAWWHDHIVSLESAYGRTPYFEFYIDRFKPWLRDINPAITDMDRALTELLCQALLIPAKVTYAVCPARMPGCTDLRAHPFTAPLAESNPTGLRDVPYYQVRADRLGFTPELSVLDLLFNMGPESPLILASMAL